MKIILSRKSVDSSAGGFASPIFPDGRMLSIPIPDKRSVVRYQDLQAADSNRSIGKLVRELSAGKLRSSAKAHVDPDLYRHHLRRDAAWRPLFGQCGAAQSHLNSLAVGRGDLFLFFGWFRQVEQYRRRWRYVAGAPDLHVIYGWQQVESVVPVDNILQDKNSAWMHYHPHCLAVFKAQNVIYTAARHLSGTKEQLPGAGTFDQFRPALCLTEEGAGRSTWRLPRWIHPSGRSSTLSYHADPGRWSKHRDHVLLRSAARGQEFVLNVEDYPEAVSWVRELMSGQ